MSAAPGFRAARVKAVCLVLVLAGCVTGVLGAGSSDLAVMLAIVGFALFIGLGLVPLAQVAAGARLPRWFAGLFVVQALAIGAFPLLQPVQGAGQTGPHVGLVGLLGVTVSDATPYQLLALVVLVVAIGCCLGSFVALRRQSGRPDWVRPPAGPIGFYAEGRGVRERRD